MEMGWGKGGGVEMRWGGGEEAGIAFLLLLCNDKWQYLLHNLSLSCYCYSVHAYH